MCRYLILTFLFLSLSLVAYTQVGERISLNVGFNASSTSNQSVLRSYERGNFVGSDFSRIDSRIKANFNFGLGFEVFKNHSLLIKYGRFDLKNNIDAMRYGLNGNIPFGDNDFTNYDYLLPIVFTGVYYEFQHPLKVVNLMAQIGIQKQKIDSGAVPYALGFFTYDAETVHQYVALGVSHKMFDKIEWSFLGFLNNGPSGADSFSNNSGDIIDGDYNPISFGAEIGLRFRFFGNDIQESN